MTESIYAMTKQLPAHEQFGLVTQMRRAAISVASNIAEGAARSGNQDKVQFFVVARGSLSELDTQVELSRRLHGINSKTTDQVKATMNEVSYLLQGLIATQRAKGQRP